MSMSQQNESPMGRTVSLDYSAIESQLQFLKGKVLTVVDASFSDERQVKAVKDLVKNAFSEQIAYVGQLCFPEVRMLTRNQANEVIGDVEEVEANAESI